MEVSRRWVRNSLSSSTEKTEIRCHECQKLGHKQRNCPDVKKSVANEFGPCPACKGNHTYKPDRNSSQEKAISKLHTCKKFKEDLEVEDRVKVDLDCKGCTRCTSWTHTRDDCRGKMTCRDCGSVNNNTLLHGSTNTRVNQAATRSAQVQVAAESKETVTIGGDEVQLQLQMVKFRGGDMGLVFFEAQQW